MRLKMIGVMVKEDVYKKLKVIALMRDVSISELLRPVIQQVIVDNHAVLLEVLEKDEI